MVRKYLIILDSEADSVMAYNIDYCTDSLFTTNNGEVLIISASSKINAISIAIDKISKAKSEMEFDWSSVA